jgi:hypothetical protein|tara:strand:- start:349 stop:522 length:174 start_codon:yes stop_codon:yes gene_type:complete
LLEIGENFLRIDLSAYTSFFRSIEIFSDIKKSPVVKAFKDGPTQAGSFEVSFITDSD